MTTSNGPEYLNGGFGMIYYFIDTIHMFSHKMIQIILGMSLSLDLIRKASLIQSQHIFIYPDKYVEVIQKPTTRSPELHSTKLKLKNKGYRDVGGDTFDKIYIRTY